MYIYEPWVPWWVAAEQKATRGVEKSGDGGDGGSGGAGSGRWSTTLLARRRPPGRAPLKKHSN